jgi:DNA primase
MAIKKQAQPKTKPIAGHIDIESIKARADILAIVENYGLKVRKAGHTFKSCCPFHTEKTPSFVIYPDENRFHCFGCQADGDVFGFVMKIENCDFKTAAVKVGDLL